MSGRKRDSEYNADREMRRQFETMHALHGIALEITSQLEDKQVLAAIVKQAAHLLETSGGLLAICDPRTGLLRVEALHNIPSEYKKATAPAGDGLWGQVMATGSPAIVNDYRLLVKENPSLRTTSPENWPYNAVLAVPLVWQDRIFGLLVVLHAGERRPFTEDDARLLSLLSSLASTAINNAQLYSQVLQLSRQLEQKVEEREAELSTAREELAQKAEQLQRLLAATVRVQEEERSRIAADLHDGSNQLIAGAIFEIQAVQESIRGKRVEGVPEKLESIKTLLRQMEVANRRSIAGLRPPLLDTHGLIPALKWQTVNYRDTHGMDCILHVYGKVSRMSTVVETAVYRITQESLSNVAAHARAKNVTIRLDFTPRILHLLVEDDGVGFSPENISIVKPGRLGLIGMRERAQSIGGRVEIQSLPGRGTRVVVDIPLSSDSVG